LVGIVFMIIQSGVAFGYFWAEDSSLSMREVSERMASAAQNGILVSLMTLATAVVCGGLVLWLVYRRSISVRNYLALKPAAPKQLALWITLLLVFSFLSNYITAELQRDVVTDFVRDLVGNAGNIYLLAFAIIVAAPLFEELFFRGFMFAGIANSSFGVIAAVLMTALIWTVIHGQYDWYTRLQIFAIGILLGAARAQSGSLLPPVLMHALMNGLALIEVGSA
jgi:membrane protease YdiL (CAAX protease family)